MNIKTHQTPTGTYKTGRFQGSGKRWYGKMVKGIYGPEMKLIDQKEYELALNPPEKPKLEELPF